jgi:hypothetical protein
MIVHFDKLHIGKKVRVHSLWGAFDGFSHAEGFNVDCEIVDMVQDKRFESGWGVKLKVVDYPEFGDVRISNWLDTGHISAEDC